MLLSVDLRRNAITFGDISFCLFACLFLSPSGICMLYTTGIDTSFLFSFFCLGFPNEPAADIALNTVKRWIEENPDKVGHACIIHVVDRRPLPHL